MNGMTFTGIKTAFGMVASLLVGAVAMAMPQEARGAEYDFQTAPSQNVDNFFARNSIFNHLEGGLTLGTTGVGLELATPITKWVRLRAGYDFVPHFRMNSHFDVMSYGGTEVSESTFEKAQDVMYQLTGYHIDSRVKMQNTVTFQNWKVLLDVFPIPDNRHWRVTFGLFGGSPVVGKTLNAMNEMTTTVAIGMYNNIYEMTTDPDFVYNCIDDKFLGIMYLDPEAAQKLQDTMLRYGRIGIHVGDHKDGTPYIMEPDADGTISAKALVNRVRPYVGLGYEGGLSKDGRWRCGLDVGAMIWGGAPKVVTHDGTVINDLVNLRGDVQQYIDAMKAFPVYPVLNFRISYSFF